MCVCPSVCFRIYAKNVKLTDGVSRCDLVLMRKPASFACPSHTLTLQPLHPSPPLFAFSSTLCLVALQLGSSTKFTVYNLLADCWRFAKFIACYIYISSSPSSGPTPHTHACEVCFFIEQCVLIIMCCIIIFVLQNRRMQRSS